MPLVYCFLKLRKYYCQYKRCPRNSANSVLPSGRRSLGPYLFLHHLWMSSIYIPGMSDGSAKAGEEGHVAWISWRWPQLPGPSLFPSGLLSLPHQGHARHSPHFQPRGSSGLARPPLTLVSLVTECSGAAPTPRRAGGTHWGFLESFMHAG